MKLNFSETIGAGLAFDYYFLLFLRQVHETTAKTTTPIITANIHGSPNGNEDDCSVDADELTETCAELSSVSSDGNTGVSDGTFAGDAGGLTETRAGVAGVVSVSSGGNTGAGFGTFAGVAG
jgi:hypothetical protein